MSESMFNSPAKAEAFKMEQHENCAVIVQPLAYRENVATADFGDKDAIEARIHVLDGAEQGKVYDSTLIFSAVMLGQLRPFIASGGMVLGRVIKGVATKGNPPWILTDGKADPALVQTATQYMTWYQSQQFSGPAANVAPSNAPQSVQPMQQQPQPQQPAPAPVQQQPAAPTAPWAAGPGTAAPAAAPTGPTPPWATG